MVSNLNSVAVSSRTAPGPVTPEQDGLVCLTNPYVWPEVRRGSEAVVRGLAMWMVTQGISVEVVGGGATRGLRSLDGVPVVVVRARDLRRLHHDLDAETTLLPPLALHLRRRKHELALAAARDEPRGELRPERNIALSQQAR